MKPYTYVAFMWCAVSFLSITSCGGGNVPADEGLTDDAAAVGAGARLRETSPLEITSAVFDAAKGELRVAGRLASDGDDNGGGKEDETRSDTRDSPTSRRMVAVSDAATDALLGNASVARNGEWKFTLLLAPRTGDLDLSTVPCRVRARFDALSAQREVRNAPHQCGQGPGGGVPPPTNQPPNGTITSPSAGELSVQVGQTVNFTGQGLDPDANVPLTYLWNFGGASANTTQQSPGNVTFTRAGTYTVTFLVSDALGLADPTPDSRVIRVSATDLPNTSHAGRYSVYEGSKTCNACHGNQALDVHASVHYQWHGVAPYATNVSTGGKMGSLNDFCGFPDINFIGQMTNLAGQTVDGGCAQCHVGMGGRPQETASDQQLGNIDCLICHSEEYKRKVVKLADGSLQFAPAPEKMAVPLLQAITDIQATPTRGSCVNCHSYAGGGCNNKRGDMEEAHRNPPSAGFDVHMASRELGGAGLVCVDCHTTESHRIAGRGSDLAPTDLDVPVRCTNCHAARPHGVAAIDKHTARVDCSVCHIPHFAKIASTDMVRDFSKPAVVVPATQLYEPYIERQALVVPEYRFWNGTSTFYVFGARAVPETNGRVMMSAPVGSISDRQAKLFAFKHHRAVQPEDPVTGRLLPMKAGVLFQTGNIAAAITTGTAEVGWSLAQGYRFVDTERYMGIFHEVSPASEALTCNACHNGAGRVDFVGLGYAPRAQRNPASAANCATGCHSNEADEWNAAELFVQVHARHVDREHLSCSECHSF